MPLKPPKGTVERYIARKMDKEWVVAFGRFDESKSKFLIVYEAVQQSPDLKEFKVMKRDPPLEDTDAYFHAAKAHQLVTNEFLRDMNPQRSYNLSVLPAASGGWYVYAIPAQTDLAVLPYGGDIRYLVSADGTAILEKRQMHKTVLEEKVTLDTALGFHTHILSDIPEDSDLFYALTRNATNGELIATKKYLYKIHQGSLSYLGKTDEVLKLIQAGKYEDLPDQYNRMVAVSLQRLLDSSFPANPLEAVTSLVGTRCTDKTVWLKFSTTVRNIGDGRVVLLNDALQNSQVRFAKNEADLKSDKYEKVVFFSQLEEDFSNKNSYTMLSPSMGYTKERDYPILGLDLTGKTAVQFLFFTWPIGEEKQADAPRKVWEPVGSLYTETLATVPSSIKIDPKWSTECVAK
jgi:hypothetical protein